MCSTDNFLSSIFSSYLKFVAGYITGQWDKFRVNNATLYLHIHFCHFIKKYVFYDFHFLFWWSVNLRNIIWTNLKLELKRYCQWNCAKKHWKWEFQEQRWKGLSLNFYPLTSRPSTFQPLLLQELRRKL